MCPAVVLRVTGSSAQLASQWSHRSRSPRSCVPPKVSPRFLVPLKYLHTLLICSRCCRVGCCLCLPKRLAAYATSGRVLLDIHWALPTSSRNSAFSCPSSSGKSVLYIILVSSGLPTAFKFNQPFFPRIRSIYGPWLILIVFSSLSRTNLRPRNVLTSPT